MLQKRQLFTNYILYIYRKLFVMTYCNLFTQMNTNYLDYTTTGGVNFGVYGNSVFGSGFSNFGFGSMPFMSAGWTNFFPSFTPSFTPDFSNMFNFDLSKSFANFGSFGSFDFSKAFSGLNFTFNPTAAVTNSNTSSTSTQTYTIGDFDLDYWKSKGYDHEKGKALALDAAKVKRGTPGQCVGYTRKTINKVYGTNFTNAGAAEHFGTTILSQPALKDKFRLATKEEIEKGGIPDGAVVLWKPGSPGFTKGKSAKYGHGGICYQNAVYSNYVETKRLGTAYQIWIPVTKA